MPDSVPAPRLDPRAHYPYLDLKWGTTDRFEIEAHLVKHGGYYKGVGMGLTHHFKCAMAALWPLFDWYQRCPAQSQWSHIIVEGFCEHDEVAVLGPASSGKTYVSAAVALASEWIWPENTTIMVSTTTKDALDMRIFGAIVELYKKAKQRKPELEGHLAGSKHRLTMRPIDYEEDEGADKRDGVLGIACKVGDRWVGISNYVGLKNERVIMIADEGHLMAPGFLNSVSNLRKNPSFKLLVLGNPKDPTDPLGKAAEPRSEDGGWDGYSPEKRTRSWRTRSGGLAIQICGLDSPNYAYARGVNPYRHLITPEQIDKDVREYGEDSLQVSMMNYGIMPRTGSTKRVVDMLLCERNQAFDEPIWEDVDKLVHVAGLDAAYSGTGGDRCVFTHLVFGPDRTGKILLAFYEPQLIVPINPALKEIPEDQITEWVSRVCHDRGIKPENFGLDSTGRGTLVSSLARKWSDQVLAIEFGGPPSEDRIESQTDPRTEFEVYYNQVTALWYATRRTVLTRQFRRIPREAVEEAQMREWTIGKTRGRSSAPLIQVEPKDKMKVRMARSPDLWDSVAVALEVARTRGFEIAGGFKTGVETRKNQEWLRKLQQRNTDFRRAHSLIET